MPYTTGDGFPSSQTGSRLAGTTDGTPGPAPGPIAVPAVGSSASPPEPETHGCLFALSQPPLLLFLAVVGTLAFLAAVHDLFLL